jgi:hypothetical protein
MSSQETDRPILISEAKREQLRFALKELKFASTRIYQSAKGEEPFKLSKLLNVMGKMTQDNIMILSMLLGDTDIKPELFETSFESSTIKIFNALVEELREDKKL